MFRQTFLVVDTQREGRGEEERKRDRVQIFIWSSFGYTISLRYFALQNRETKCDWNTSETRSRLKRGRHCRVTKTTPFRDWTNSTQMSVVPSHCYEGQQTSAEGIKKILRGRVDVTRRRDFDSDSCDDWFVRFSSYFRPSSTSSFELASLLRSWNIQNEIWNNGSCLVAGWRHGRTHIYAPMRLYTYTGRAYIHVYMHVYMCAYTLCACVCVHTQYVSAWPAWYICTPYAIYTSTSRSIFSILSRTSYVRINPYASLNDILAYHVGILNATEADSSRSSDPADQAHL